MEEYEIDTALIESLNSVEKRAAVETGQEVDRQDINLNSRSNARVDLLAKTFSLAEIDEMERRMKATAAAEERRKLIDATPDEKEASKQPVGDALDRPGKPESAAPAGKQRLSLATPGQPDTGAAGEAVPSVPQAPRSWRD